MWKKDNTALRGKVYDFECYVRKESVRLRCLRINKPEKQNKPHVTLKRCKQNYKPEGNDKSLRQLEQEHRKHS